MFRTPFLVIQMSRNAKKGRLTIEGHECVQSQNKETNMKKANNPCGDAAKKSNEPRYEGTNWDEPIVRVRRNGSTRQQVKRKVLTRGIKRIHAFALTKEAIVKYLREGYEVRITDANDKDMIRLFPCMSKDMKKLTITAQTMGEFRECISDKKVHIYHGGKELSKHQAEKMVIEQRERVENRLAVTPDTVVTCPKCGTEFRVGKELK